MRHRKLDCDVSDLVTGPEAMLIARRTAAPTFPDLAARIEDVLLDHGFSVPPECLMELEEVVEDHSFQLAGSFVRNLILSLGKSPAAIALARALLGTDGQSLEQDSLAAGCSKQNLHRKETAMRRKLGVTSGAIYEQGIDAQT